MRWPVNCACPGCVELRAEPDQEVRAAVRRLNRDAGRWFGAPTGGPVGGCEAGCECAVCQLAGGGAEELSEVW